MLAMERVVPDERCRQPRYRSPSDAGRSWTGHAAHLCARAVIVRRDIPRVFSGRKEASARYMARASEANEPHSLRLISMHVVRGRPVRTGELNDELHLASCGVALDPFDHRERAVVMDDVRLVHGVRAGLISEA